jgi:hypothetical protein
MSANADNARELAQRIAARLNTGDAGAPSDLGGLRATLSEISRRLDRIEARISPGSANATTGAYSPWTPPDALHASQEKFDVEEATVAEMVDYFESTKKCDLEPGGQPCDHCSMCSSRGF